MQITIIFSTNKEISKKRIYMYIRIEDRHINRRQREKRERGIDGEREWKEGKGRNKGKME